MLTQLADLRDGVGSRLAFAPDSDRWAAASSSLLHVRRGLELEATAASAGDLLGEVRFERDGTRVLVSPHIFDLDAAEWVPLPPLDDALQAGLDPEPEPGGFAAHAGAWAPDARNLVVYAEYRAPRGRGAASGYRGPTKRLLLLDGRLRELLGVLWEDAGWEERRTVAVDDRHVAAAGVRIGLWRLANQERAAELEHHSGTVRSLAFSADGALLASVGADRQVALWGVADGQLRASWEAGADDVRAVAFHPGEPLLATGGSDGTVRLWSLDGDRVGEQSADGQVEGLVFSPRGDRLVAARSGSNPALLVYDVGR